MTQLARTGVVVRGADGRLAVAFDQERCDGCDGGCGLRLGATPPLALRGLPLGSPVEVVVATKRLRRCAAAVFGAPLAATVGLAALAEGAAWQETAVLGAALLGLAVPFLLRPFAPRRSWSSHRRGRRLRVELR